MFPGDEAQRGTEVNEGSQALTSWQIKSQTCLTNAKVMGKAQQMGRESGQDRTAGGGNQRRGAFLLGQAVWRFVLTVSSLCHLGIIVINTIHAF